MAEQQNHHSQHSIAEQEKELCALLEKLTNLPKSVDATANKSAEEAPDEAMNELVQEMLHDMMKDSTDSTLHNSSTTPDPTRFNYFTSKTPIFIDPSLADIADEDDLDEDDHFLDSLLLINEEYEDNESSDEDIDEIRSQTVLHETPSSVQKINPFYVLWQALCRRVPLKKDPIQVKLRKVALWLLVVICSGALTYVLYTIWWVPTYTASIYDDVAADYHAQQTGVIMDGQYPSGMQQAFKDVYDRNPEIRGWLSFHADGSKDFLDMEYPILYSGDNTKYLSVDFNGKSNRNGALFFDSRMQLNTAEDTNRVLIAYGKNPSSGQMLSGLNQLVGNLNNARAASTLKLNTLFSSGEYKVFAVVLTDKDAAGEQSNAVHRTEFKNDEDFMNHIVSLRARSIYRYPVDVSPMDELLVLSTSTAPSSAKIKNGYLTVIARRVRPQESATVPTASITRNENVIMPYSWYRNQQLPVHDYYLTTTAPSETAIETTTTGSTTTMSSESSTTTSTTTKAGTTTTTTTTTKQTTNGTTNTDISSSVTTPSSVTQ